MPNYGCTVTEGQGNNLARVQGTTVVKKHTRKAANRKNASACSGARGRFLGAYVRGLDAPKAAVRLFVFWGDLFNFRNEGAMHHQAFVFLGTEYPVSDEGLSQAGLSHLCGVKGPTEKIREYKQQCRLCSSNLQPAFNNISTAIFF